MYGQQIPRINSVPSYSYSSGVEAVELAQHAGLILDPWQQHVLVNGLGENEVGEWATFEVCTVVSRQNGKGAIIEARELAGLFLFGERLIIHTAHEFKTAQEAFGRLRMWIENNDEFRRRVKKFTLGASTLGVELMDGARLRFLSRTKGSGRGFSCDCLIMDESMILGSESMAALLPTMSARDNPQVWYFGSAGMGDVSTQLAMLRERGLAGNDDSLAYFEWSVDVHNEQCVRGCNLHKSVDDQTGWFEANPGIGYRITTEYIDRERRALGPAMFARERLGVGEYPDPEAGTSPISVAQWDDLRDDESVPDDNGLVFAVDIPPDRGSAVIAAYSETDGVGHTELIDRRAGTAWVVPRLQELVEEWEPAAIAIDGRGPAASLLIELEDAGISPPLDPEHPMRGDLYVLTITDMESGCGQMVDAVRQKDFRHLGDEVLRIAVAGAAIREITDAWVWTRRKSTMDVSPLVAVTMARYVYFAWYELIHDYDILSSAY